MKYVVEIKTMENRWEWIRLAGKKKKCVGKVGGDICMKRQMEHTHSDIVEVRKRAAGERLFSVPEYDLIARWKRVEDGSEFAEKLKNQMGEARLKRGGDSEDDFCVLGK